MWLDILQAVLPKPIGPRELVKKHRMTQAVVDVDTWKLLAKCRADGAGFQRLREMKFDCSRLLLFESDLCSARSTEIHGMGQRP